MKSTDPDYRIHIRKSDLPEIDENGEDILDPNSNGNSFRVHLNPVTDRSDSAIADRFHAAGENTDIANWAWQ